MQGDITPGRMVLISGASQSGKTTRAQQRAMKMLGRSGGRAIAFDPDAQWCRLPGWVKVTTQAELFAAVHRPGPARIAYVIPKLSGEERAKKEFQFWAGCVMFWAEHCGPCIAACEELADVTGTGKATGNYGVLLRRGLKLGIYFFLLIQRWQEGDKTAMGNASEFDIFNSLYEDCHYMARKIGLDAQMLAALKPFEFVNYDKATKQATLHKLPPARKKHPTH